MENDLSSLFESIEKYVSDHRARQKDGRTADVTDDDIIKLYDIIEDIVDRKFEPDYDDYRPLKFLIYDDTSYDLQVFPLIPRERDKENPLKRCGRLQTLLTIMHCISSDIDREMQILSHHEYINSKEYLDKRKEKES